MDYKTLRNDCGDCAATDTDDAAKTEEVKEEAPAEEAAAPAEETSTEENA
ncbi:MAG: hypothetical protein GXP44_00215 [bacterium]|nr:hypothetical protein [bacterium]